MEEKKEWKGEKAKKTSLGFSPLKLIPFGFPIFMFLCCCSVFPLDGVRVSHLFFSSPRVGGVDEGGKKLRSTNTCQWRVFCQQQKRQNIDTDKLKRQDGEEKRVSTAEEEIKSRNQPDLLII